MTTSVSVGLVLVALGGTLLGLFSLPVTKTPGWTFEQIWGVGSLIALLALPWPVALLTVPKVGAVYAAVPTGTLLLVILCGIGWGIGGIYWGRAIEALGMALGVSLLMGLINVFGSIAPLAVFQPGKLATPGGLALAGAVAVMVAGVAVVAAAGKRRAAEQGTGAGTRSSTSFALGLVFCLVSGVLSALVNFGFIAGQPVADAAAAFGAPGFAIAFPVWSLVFTGNYLVNTIYALVLMIRRGTLATLIPNGSPAYWAAALFMGLAWPGGILVYGIGAGALGPYGAYAGFPMMILVSILAGNVAGAIGGEWKGSQRSSRLIMAAGVAIMVAAFALLGYSNQLLSSTGAAG